VAADTLPGGHNMQRIPEGGLVVVDSARSAMVSAKPGPKADGSGFGCT